MKSFDFGQNWIEFSRQALTEDRVLESRRSFYHLLAETELAGRRLLDVGCGQGLSALAAAKADARVLAIDINPKSLAATRHNHAAYYPDLSDEALQLDEGSILDPGFVTKLASHGPFDIVHSWGVLHHTGDMESAIENAASLVREQGKLVIALYQKHWSSRAWRWIKAIYNRVPPWAQRAIVAVFQPIIWLATRLASGESPSKKERGMDFRYDIIDWLGGYPYEYASIAEVKEQLGQLGFETQLVIPPRAPTGCVEYIFKRTANQSA